MECWTEFMNAHEYHSYMEQRQTARVLLFLSGCVSHCVHFKTFQGAEAGAVACNIWLMLLSISIPWCYYNMEYGQTSNGSG